ncbi:MAG TPA: quinone oxidoreductase [Thermoanaerobaculia bacterium]|nr:quinone oxidoreductase [Thermoanaerobaculia bacterium]
MTHAIRIHHTGGPDVLSWEEVEIGHPGTGEVRIRHTAIGLNFIDTYYRSGLYPLPLPAILGSEGAGVVLEVGPAVTEVHVGDRVAYAGPVGSYAEERLVSAHRLVPLPDDIDDRVAAAAMLKGMTAQYLLRRTHRVERGETILLHSAAGGVGLIAAQWARSLGATVIGTVSTDEKAVLAREAGCDHVVVTSRESFVTRVKEITGGAGVRVVYDAVGKDTFDGSLDCLAPLGLMVSFGNASGAVPPVSPLVLAQKGSLFLTRPTLMTYTAKREDLLATAADLFSVIRSGVVKVRIDAAYPLREAAAAHVALEARRTTGSTVLLP